VMVKEQQHYRIPRYQSFRPMLFALVFCFFGGYWNSVMQMWVQSRVPTDMRELPDLGFQLLPHIRRLYSQCSSVNTSVDVICYYLLIGMCSCSRLTVLSVNELLLLRALSFCLFVVLYCCFLCCSET
jgi:hypothetical protein